MSTLGRLLALSVVVGVKGETGDESVGEGSDGHTASVEIQGLEGGRRGALDGGSSSISSFDFEFESDCSSSLSFLSFRFLQLS